jgi:hypothetical protein
MLRADLKATEAIRKNKDVLKGGAVVPASYVSPTEMRCLSAPIWLGRAVEAEVHSTHNRRQRVHSTHITRRVTGPHRKRPLAGPIVPSVLPGRIHVGLMPVIIDLSTHPAGAVHGVASAGVWPARSHRDAGVST